jgi:hypothetical protein
VWDRDLGFSKGDCMKKNDLKYILDVTLFMVISTIASLGLMLGFIIPRGKGSQALFMGLHRHTWGDLHLYFSLLLLILLPLHLWLNWTWIVQSSKKYLGRHWREALWGIACAWMVIVLITWILVLLA